MVLFRLCSDRPLKFAEGGMHCEQKPAISVASALPSRAGLLRVIGTTICWACADGADDVDICHSSSLLTPFLTTPPDLVSAITLPLASSPPSTPRPRVCRLLVPAPSFPSLNRPLIVCSRPASHCLSRLPPPPTPHPRVCKVAMVLNIDPRKANQTVRGTVQLPRGSGKSVRVGRGRGVNFSVNVFCNLVLRTWKRERKKNKYEEGRGGRGADRGFAGHIRSIICMYRSMPQSNEIRRGGELVLGGQFASCCWRLF